MNVIFKRPKTTASLIEDIRAKITFEQARILELEGKYGAAALDAENGDDKHLNDLSAELAKSKTRLANLQAALVEAEKREQAEVAARLEAEWQAKVEHFKKGTDRHAGRAERLRQATAAFVEAHEKFVESGVECLRTYPTGGLPPPGSIFDAHSIHKALALELARLQEPVLGEPETNRIPGSAMATSHYNPNAIKPLIENVLDSNAHALKAAKKGKPK